MPYWVTGDEKLVSRTMALPPEEQKREIEAAGEEAIYSYNQTDFLKERVAIEVQFGKYSFVAYDLFVKHLAFYVGDEIDVGVEILPVKSLQSQMSSGVAYYEGELYNVMRPGRGVPPVPLIMVGIGCRRKGGRAWPVRRRFCEAWSWRRGTRPCRERRRRGGWRRSRGRVWDWGWCRG